MLAPNPGRRSAAPANQGKSMKPFAIVVLAACLCATACARKVKEEPAPVAVEAPAPVSLDETLSGDALFAFGSAELSDGGRAQLDAFIARLQAAPDGYARIHVIGHSDRLGRAKVNEAVSTRRAEAVRDYLVQAGIPEARLTAVGRGSAESVAECPDERGQALIDCLAPNRRVDLRVERP
jgi:outer membrane protein OmpA-like peptidoglycan-associated protein